MRCLSCNKILNKFERTSKYAETGEYLDLCTNCRQSADLPEGSIQDNPEMINVKEED